MNFEKHALVADYLKRVSRQFRDKKRKLEVREEILSHLEAELGDEASDEAIRAVLANFGKPENLGRSLRKAQRRWVQKFFAFAGTAIVIAVVGAIMTSRYYMNIYEQMIAEANDRVEHYLSRFEADQNHLSKLEVFKESTMSSKDAGEFLNDRVRWRDEDENVRIDIKEDPLRRDWWSSWIDVPIPETLLAVDLTWVTLLLKYDYWDIYAHGRYSYLLGTNAKVINLYAAPMPDMGFIQSAARLRLRRGLDDKNPIPALREVHHLARLAYTTETLIGSMVAVYVLKLEHLAYTAAVQRKLIKPSDYSITDDESLVSMKAALWAATGFADYTNPEMLKRIFPSTVSNWPAGSCAALSESFKGFAFTMDYLKKKYPLEKGEMDYGFSTYLEIFEASRPRCRLTFDRQVLSRRAEYAAYSMTPESISAWDSDWFGLIESYYFLYGRHIPFLRQSIGTELLAIARPDFTMQYQQVQ